ncbi:hypothetical protein [Dactylosporangium sp. CA-092794]|uniref:5'-methylthioadenosine/S-adenosylhomocysteine nucleosidase family protein n=1 Tax=Dactylosporangium sp. CA-092794 TaxID=3239929 RepID=UPI003D9422F6
MIRRPAPRDCLAAARSVRAAELRRPAVDTIRPRGPVGIYRSAAPLTVLLLIAAAEGRLVWRGPDSFAVLQRPFGRGGSRHRGFVLRLVTERWDVVLTFGPLIPLLLAALAVGATGRPWAVMTALSLIVAAMAVLAFAMVCLVGYSTWQLVRSIVRPARDTDDVGAETLPTQRWTLVLCHHVRPQGADELLRDVQRQLKALLTAEAGRDLDEHGVRAQALRPTETLVCLRSGVTTRQLQARIAAWSSLAGTGDKVLFRLADRPRRAPIRYRDTGTFLFWYVAGMIVLIVCEAVLIPDMERAACAAAACTGHPVTYRLAVQWLAQRLLLNDPPGLTPLSGTAWAIGWLTSLMALTGVGVFVTAVRQHIKYRGVIMEAINTVLEEAHRRTVVLILVATDVERFAVIEAAGRVNGATPQQRFLPQQVVFELGLIGGAEVLLAQSGQGAVSPTGAAITAASLIDNVRPDYLILTGICYGLRPDEQRLGDIIVGRQVRAIDHQKVTMSEDGAEEVTYVRGDFVTASATLVSRFTVADRPDGVSVHVGQLLSGSTLVDSERLRDKLVKLDPEALGGEMEGAGVYAAAAPRKTDWIVVKAISDWAHHKTYDAQPRAAANVAEFVVSVIRSGALDERELPANAR